MLTDCETNVHQTVQQREIVRVELALLPFASAKRPSEGVHGLSRVETLLIKGIIEGGDGHQSTSEGKIFGEVLGEMARVERVTINERRHGCWPRASLLLSYRTASLLVRAERAYPWKTKTKDDL